MPFVRLSVRKSSTVEPLESRIAPATFVVNLNSDEADANPGDGIADTDLGTPGLQTTLRAAIMEANALANVGGADFISFAGIGPGPSAFVIQPTSPLPAISEAVIIDGYTAPGAAVNSAAIGTNAVIRVVINGENLFTGSGLVLGVAGGDPEATGGSTVRGLAIHSFNSSSSEQGNGILIQSNDNQIQGNFIGTTETGLSGTGNREAGIAIRHSNGSEQFADNVIGGINLGDRNLISKNGRGVELLEQALDTIVQNNLIGTDATGNVALPNNVGIRIEATGSQIGGSAPGMGNLISGNSGLGISIRGAGFGTVVQGNTIGLGAAGTQALPNGGGGIGISDGGSGLIGGSTAGAGNIISGNGSDGVQIGSSDSDGGESDEVTVLGNKIGTDATGSLPFGNQGHGIVVYGSVNSFIGGTNPGEANVIVYNQGAGVRLQEESGEISIRISGNSIHSNAGLGIDLIGGSENSFGVTTNDAGDGDSGVNGLTNFPVLSNLSNTGTGFSVQAALNARPNTQYVIEFFVMAPNQLHGSGHGGGTVYVGSKTVTTDASGNVVVTHSGGAFPADSYFSATAIENSTGNTSEFSRSIGPTTTYTWTGSQSSDWFTPGNWSPNGVPGPLDTAVYNGGTTPLQLDGLANIAVFQHTNGAFTGAGSLIINNNFTWTGGQHNGPSVTLSEGSVSSLNGAPVTWVSGNLEVQGTLTVNSVQFTFNAGDFTVTPTGRLTTAGLIIDQNGINTLSHFYNFGLVQKIGGGDGGIRLSTFENNSAVEMVGGLFYVSGFTQLNGRLSLLGGSLNAFGTLVLNEGVLEGTGPVSATILNDGGYISPGLGDGTSKIGTISITGTYTQTGSGTIVTDLAGLNAGTGYDQVTVSGTANLAGVLNVTIASGFAPLPGNTFNVLSATTLNGTFQFTVGEGLLTNAYTATQAQLVRNGQTLTWDGGGGTDFDWSNPLNWTSDTVPTNADVAVLNTSATILVDVANISVGDFIQSNGTLTGSKMLTTLGSFQWSGGTQSGSGTTSVPIDGRLIISGPASKILDARTIRNADAGDWAGTGNFIYSNNGLVRNTGILTVHDGFNLQASAGGGRLENSGEGALRKVGTGTFNFPGGLVLDNNGQLEVAEGTFNIGAEGTASDGTFTVLPGANLHFNVGGAGYHLMNTVLFNGGGTVTLQGGILTDGEEGGTIVEAGTTFAVAGGQYTGSDAGLIIDGTLALTGGTFNGSGSGLVINGTLTQGNSLTTFSDWFVELNGSGTMLGTLTLDEGATLAVNGLLDMQGGATISHAAGLEGSVQVGSTGTLRKSGAGNSSIGIDVGFLLDGKLDVQGGTLSLQGSGLVGGQAGGAAMFAGAGATIALDSRFDFAGASTFDGPGTLQIGSGVIMTLTTGASFTAAGTGLVELLIGTIDGPGNLTINSSFHWSGGSLTGTGNTSIGGATTLDGGFRTIDARTVKFSGTVSDISTTDFVLLNGALLQVGGTYEAQAGHAFLGGNGGTVQILPGGTFTTTVGTVGTTFDSGVQLINSGTVSAESAPITIAGSGSASGKFIAALNHPITFDGGTFTASAGTVFDSPDGGEIRLINNALFSFTAGGSINNNAVVRIAAGTLALGGTTTLNDGTTLVLEHASAAVTGSGDLIVIGDVNVVNGSFTGTGDINISNSGTMYASTLTLGRALLNEGDLTLAGTTVLQSSTEISNAGSLTLDGTNVFSGSGSLHNLPLGSIVKSSGGTATFSGVTLVNEGAADFSDGDLAADLTITTATGTFIPGANTTANFVLTSGTFSGGTDSGTQTITGNVQNNGAIFAIKLPEGKFLINGNYTQAAGGSLDLELRGTGSDEFNQLEVSGDASLAGTLNVTLGQDYEPQGGDMYRIVDAGTVTGAFTTENLPATFSASTLADGVVVGAPGDPLEVTTTADTIDAGDGLISLREAIIFANMNAGDDVITFAIPGTGVHRISVTSELPAITEKLKIDGYSQTGSVRNSLFTSTNAVLTIELNGASAGTTANGLIFDSQSNVVTGIVINGFGGSGVVLNDAFNVVEGCFIGTNAAGTTAIPNGGHGVLINNSNENLIGGGAQTEMNLISGNAQDGVRITGTNAEANIVMTNLIGTTAAATAALGNGASGVHLRSGASFNIIGGDGVEIFERNVISGNTLHGVQIEGASTEHNSVLGNFIGTNGAGTAAVGNVGAGVSIEEGAHENTVGGNAANEGNVISGNFNGVAIWGEGTFGNEVSANLIGTNATGLLAIGNLNHGVSIFSFGSSNIIGGSVAGMGNVISGNIGSGIEISEDSSTNNEVKGNFIGTKINGVEALPNSLGGIVLNDGAAGTKIGGATVAERNVISGNGGSGISIIGTGSTGSVTSNVIQGNYIGVDKNGVLPLGNQSRGIMISNASGNTIGTVSTTDTRNVIAFNGDDGIAIFGLTARGNVIIGNSIHSNIGLGIDLGGNGYTPNDQLDEDSGPNDLINFPTFIADYVEPGQASVNGTISGAPNSTLRIEFFAGSAPNVHGVVQGRQFLDFLVITTDATGAANFSMDVLGFGANDFITATATEFSGSGTSEFAGAIAAPLSDPELVNSANSYTFTDANGDRVRVKLSGPGSLQVSLQGGALDNANIKLLELVGTTLASKVDVTILTKGGTTTIDRIFTRDALQHLGAIKLGAGVTLGDGVADEHPDLRITGKLASLNISAVQTNTFIKLGEGLPYNVPNDTKTPDTYNNRPTVTIGSVLGAGFVLEVTGDGTDGGVGGGGLGNITFGFWQDPGFIRTTQSIGNFLVKTGNFNGVLEVDKFHVGNATTANAGTMTIAQGSWGSSGTEIEGAVAGFSATEFLASASITAASIGFVTMTTGDLAGTLILTDPDAPGLPTYTINSDFVGSIISAQSIKKLNIKGDFTGSLEAPSIGAITAFSFLGTEGVTKIKATVGALGLLTAKSGNIRDYIIEAAQAFTGIKVKVGKLTSNLIGIDNVDVKAGSIGSITVDLVADAKSTGVNLTGIFDSTFTTTATGTLKNTTGKIGNVLVKLKGAAGGNGTAFSNSTFDARVEAGEFGPLASSVNALGTITATVAGFGGESIGLRDLVFRADSIGAVKSTVTKGKDLLATGYGIHNVDFRATNTIGAMTVAGDVTLDQVRNLSVWAGGKIGAISVKAKTTSLGSFVDSSIAAGQSLNPTGDDKAVKLALANAALGAVTVSGALTNSKLIGAANIGAVTVGGAATDSLVLAGARLGGDFVVGNGNDTFQRAATIAAITVKGALTRSSLVAGVASTNGTFGDGDDVLAAAAGNLTARGGIGAVTLGDGSGASTPVGAVAHSYAIQAAAIKSLKSSGGDLVKDFATMLFLDATAAGEDATDVLVRLIP